jgi:hypothetical protein
MSKYRERKDGSSLTVSGEGASPECIDEMSAEDFPRALAEGGKAAMNALVEKAETAPGSVFDAEALSALAQLAKGNFPAWVDRRARLKSEAGDVPIADCDKRVRPNGAEGGGGDGLPGRPITFDEIEPWEESVDGAALLSEIADTVGRYVVMDAHQRDACALWAAHAHAHDIRDMSPPLVIKSLTMRSGKTRLLETLERLVPRPLLVSGITTSFLERAIEVHRPSRKPQRRVPGNLEVQVRVLAEHPAATLDAALRQIAGLGG